MISSPFQVHERDRVALVIDGPSIYQTSKHLGFDVDYGKILSLLRESCRFYRAYYYTVLRETEAGLTMMPLVDWLEFNGYTVFHKVMREFELEDGRRKTKGTIIPEISTDLGDIATQVDHILLVSGDGDLAYAVEAAQRKGCKVTIISSTLTSPAAISDELRRRSDHFLDLEFLRPAISRRHPDATVRAARARIPGVTT